MDSDYLLDSLQWVFVCMECLSLIVFIYFFYEYCKQSH